MAEAMGFELMDLLQSTVFKSMTKASNFNGLLPEVFRFDCAPAPFERPVMANSASSASDTRKQRVHGLNIAKQLIRMRYGTLLAGCM